MEMVVQFEPENLFLRQVMFDECQTRLIGKPFRSGCSFAFVKQKQLVAFFSDEQNIS